MSDIMIEPVKAMLEKACEAASQMISKHDGKETTVEIEEYKFEDTITLYLKCNNKVMFKHIWKMNEATDELDARLLMYGTLMTELLSVFCITVTKLTEQLELVG